MTLPSFRQATDEDTELCLHLHRAASGPYITALWGEDDDVQRRFQPRVTSCPSLQVITVDGRDVGLIDVDRRPSEIHLERLEIHPEHQGRGIGSHFVRSLLAEAAQFGKPLALDVLSTNRRARTLYQRLGLDQAPQNTATSHTITMRSSQPRQARPRDASRDAAGSSSRHARMPAPDQHDLSHRQLATTGRPREYLRRTGPDCDHAMPLAVSSRTEPVTPATSSGRSGTAHGKEQNDRHGRARISAATRARARGWSRR